MSKSYHLRDFATKERVTPTSHVFTGENGPWEVVMDLEQIKSRINKEYFRKSPPLVSKYLPLMPVADHSSFISLKEGSTPLIKSTVIGPELGIDLHFKLESQNPTGSFKDRGSAVELTIAKELGVKAITVASTGNMAASCSCYAAAAQLPCFIFVPENTPASKISQSIAYGGRIVQVRGSYNDAAALAKTVAEELGFYLAGDYAFRVEGHKTAAFELLDQMYFQVPDAIMIPIGCGTNMTSYAKGFSEYKELGFINELPQLVGLQAESASPVVDSFKKGLKHIEPVKVTSTVASAIGIGDPIDGTKALDAIYSTGGYADAVSDKEMLEAQYRLSKEEGLFVEASCATTVASLLKEGKNGRFSGKTVVCVLTGGGLKDPTTILKIAIKPPTIYPKVDDFLSLYEKNIFEGKTVSFVEKDQEIFSEEPSDKELKSKLKEFFKIDYQDDFVTSVKNYITDFLKKGKPVTFSDLQDIAQDVLESPETITRKVLKVVDFEVNTRMDSKPEASVEILLSGKSFKGKSDGVGPVDALVNALRVAANNNGNKSDSNFSLVDYKVDIRSSGTNAVVYTELKLLRDGFISVGTGTSPDIIQASLKAFEEAYNGSFPNKEA